MSFFGIKFGNAVPISHLVDVVITGTNFSIFLLFLHPSCIVASEPKPLKEVCCAHQRLGDSLNSAGKAFGVKTVWYMGLLAQEELPKLQVGIKGGSSATSCSFSHIHFFTSLLRLRKVGKRCILRMVGISLAHSKRDFTLPPLSLALILCKSFKTSLGLLNSSTSPLGLFLLT